MGNSHSSPGRCLNPLSNAVHFSAGALEALRERMLCCPQLFHFRVEGLGFRGSGNASLKHTRDALQGQSRAGAKSHSRLR